MNTFKKLSTPDKAKYIEYTMHFFVSEITCVPLVYTHVMKKYVSN